MNRKESYSLVLLAGGKSSRMGSNKAELMFEGKTFTQVLLEKAQKMGMEHIVISGYEEEGFLTVWDIYPEMGPLGGLHACMNAIETPYCLVLPVDVPQIPVELLEDLIDFHETSTEKQLPVLLKHGDRRENLIGIYPAEMKNFIEERIKAKRVSAHSMLDTWGHQCVECEVSDWQVDNINTRENYEELLRLAKRGNPC